MRAAQWVEPERLEVAEVDDPVPAAGQALVEVASCGICGSDLHSFRGGLGTQPGQVLGHEFSGRVVAAPGVEGLTEGDRVTVPVDRVFPPSTSMGTRSAANRAADSGGDRAVAAAGAVDRDDA